MGAGLALLALWAAPEKICPWLGPKSLPASAAAANPSSRPKSPNEKRKPEAPQPTFAAVLRDAPPPRWSDAASRAQARYANDAFGSAVASGRGGPGADSPCTIAAAAFECWSSARAHATAIPCGGIPLDPPVQQCLTHFRTSISPTGPPAA